MDTKQLDDLLQEMDTADPADAADLAVEVARLLSEKLDPPASSEDPA